MKDISFLKNDFYFYKQPTSDRFNHDYGGKDGLEQFFKFIKGII